MLNHPKRLIIIATGMMLLGVIIPFLMVLHLLESTFFLNFLAAISSTLGFFLGFIGVALLRSSEKQKERDRNR